jgi:hypothetical protein
MGHAESLRLASGIIRPWGSVWKKPKAGLARIKVIGVNYVRRETQIHYDLLANARDSIQQAVELLA